MTIRNTLTILFITFGLIMVALLVPQLQISYRYYTKTSDQIAVDQARNDVFEAVLAIREGQTGIALFTTEGGDDQALTDDVAEAVVLLNRAAETIAVFDNATLQPLSGALAEQAAILSDAAAELTTTIAAGDPDATASTLAANDAVFAAVETETLLVRGQILQEIGIPDTTMGALQLTRNYTLSVSDLIKTDLVLAAPNATASNPRADLNIQNSAVRLRTIAQFYADIASAYSAAAVTVADDLSQFIEISYLPALSDYATAVAAGDDPVAPRLALVDVLRDADVLISRTTADLFEMSQSYLAAERVAARSRLNSLMTWTAFTTVIFVLSMYLVAQHIVRPLVYVQRKINDIAAGRLDPLTKKRPLLSDLDSVIDALRALRISTRRRETLTAERMTLNEKIVEAHAILRSEVDAAAKVQLSLLPRPEDVGHIRFSTLFQPSHVVAGDTFDYISLTDGRVGLFQIDVAGHGAAAGLVSMAAHISARRALRGVKQGTNLAQSVQTMNAHWSPGLTYFTAVVVEFDSADNVARLVQCGHPHPVLMRQDGTVLRIGKAGLPIGVLDNAEYEMITFPFNHGDRLLVFSDGIYENFDADGNIFSEERLFQLLRDNVALGTDELVNVVKESIVSWTETGVPSDDVSLVIAERI